jgi:hypothetical protein
MNTGHQSSNLEHRLRQWLGAPTFRRTLLGLIVVVYVVIEVKSALKVDYPSCVEQVGSSIPAVLCE